jgi:hypothetical protein
MTELERQLLALPVAVPDAPDLAPAVLARLEGEGRPFPWRRAAVLALAVFAVAIAAAFAVPQARTTILHWFHIGGATIERVETLPSAVERSQAGGLGRPMSRKAAEQTVGFRLLLPPYKGGGPDRVYVLGDSLATVVLGIGPNHHGLLSEFPSFGPGSMKKLVRGETRLEDARVNGNEAVWIEGGTHTLKYFDRRFGVQEQNVRIHGNVLLWVRGGLTLRLEGIGLTKGKALFLARHTR